MLSPEEQRMLFRDAPAGQVRRRRRMIVFHTIGYVLAWVRVAVLALLVAGIAMGVNELTFAFGWDGGVAAFRFATPLGQTIFIVWSMGAFFCMVTSGHSALESVRLERRRVLAIRPPGLTDSPRIVSVAASRLGTRWRTVIVDQARSGSGIPSSPQERPARAPAWARQVRVRSAEELEAVRRRIYHLFWRRVFSPRTFIVQVRGADEDLWWRTVIAFCASSDAVVVDVTHIDGHLLELSDALMGLKERLTCIFVVDRMHAEPLFIYPTEDPLAASLRRLLDGRPVLVYDTGQGSGQRFTRVLRWGLELAMAEEEGWRKQRERFAFSRDLDRYRSNRR